MRPSLTKLGFESMTTGSCTGYFHLLETLVRTTDPSGSCLLSIVIAVKRFSCIQLGKKRTKNNNWIPDHSFPARSMAITNHEKKPLIATISCLLENREGNAQGN